jgi:hypothetical protein
MIASVVLACALSASDAAYIQDALDGWTVITLDLLELPDAPLPWMILFDRSCAYRSQAQVLLDVASHLPENAAILVTRHPSTDLTVQECLYLRQRFPNLVIDREFDQIQAPTQYLLAEGDALVTIGSAVGWMAGFLGKPMVSVADCHLSPLSAVDRLADLPALLANPSRARIDDAHLAWVMFHYSIAQSLYDRDGFARRLFERFHRRDPGPFAEPVLPYAEYADLIAGTACRDLPVARQAA